MSFRSILNASSKPIATCPVHHYTKPSGRKKDKFGILDVGNFNQKINLLLKCFTVPLLKPDPFAVTKRLVSNSSSNFGSL